jgi:hypothetical protein
MGVVIHKGKFAREVASPICSAFHAKRPAIASAFSPARSACMSPSHNFFLSCAPKPRQRHIDQTSTLSFLLFYFDLRSRFSERSVGALSNFSSSKINVCGDSTQLFAISKNSSPRSPASAPQQKSLCPPKSAGVEASVTSLQYENSPT